jgi:hypothetical protein
MSECRKNLNEECVSMNEYAKHGTCQCKVGFRRNLYTVICEIFDLKAYAINGNKLENVSLNIMHLVQIYIFKSV